MLPPASVPAPFAPIPATSPRVSPRQTHRGTAPFEANVYTGAVDAVTVTLPPSAVSVDLRSTSSRLVRLQRSLANERSPNATASSSVACARLQSSPMVSPPPELTQMPSTRATVDSDGPCVVRSDHRRSPRAVPIGLVHDAGVDPANVDHERRCRRRSSTLLDHDHVRNVGLRSGRASRRPRACRGTRCTRRVPRRRSIVSSFGPQLRVRRDRRRPRSRPASPAFRSASMSAIRASVGSIVVVGAAVVDVVVGAVVVVPFGLGRLDGRVGRDGRTCSAGVVVVGSASSLARAGCAAEHSQRHSDGDQRPHRLTVIGEKFTHPPWVLPERKGKSARLDS